MNAMCISLVRIQDIISRILEIDTHPAAFSYAASLSLENNS